MSKKCPYEKKCGGCQYIDLPYEEQLKKKQKDTNKLLKSFGKVKPIIGMKDPWHYRNKVHGVVAGDRHGNCFTGIYENRSHRVIRVDSCLIENQKADEIMNTVTSLMKSFKMQFRPKFFIIRRLNLQDLPEKKELLMRTVELAQLEWSQVITQEKSFP